MDRSRLNTVQKSCHICDLVHGITRNWRLTERYHMGRARYLHRGQTQGTFASIAGFDRPSYLPDSVLVLVKVAVRACGVGD